MEAETAAGSASHCNLVSRLWPN